VTNKNINKNTILLCVVVGRFQNRTSGSHAITSNKMPGQGLLFFEYWSVPSTPNKKNETKTQLFQFASRPASLRSASVAIYQNTPMATHPRRKTDTHLARSIIPITVSRAIARPPTTAVIPGSSSHRRWQVCRQAC